MERRHAVMTSEVEDLRRNDVEQKNTIKRLEDDVRTLRETQGGDENIRAMQEKLIRLSDDQETKDRRIHELQKQLDDTNKRLREAESRAGQNGGAQQSKTCAVM